MSSTVEAIIGSQTWLETLGDGLHGAVSSVLAGGPAGETLRWVLQGDWLGHPLHPAITDIPVGAWTVAVVLDTAESLGGREDLAPGADAALLIGLVGAVGAAVTGLADYTGLRGQSRRIGMAHAMGNGIATLCMLSSLVLRRYGARGAGRAAALVGYSIANGAAYLGGSLVFNESDGTGEQPKAESSLGLVEPVAPQFP